jgi:hypothetical protein
MRRPWRKDYTTDHFHLRLSLCSAVKTEDKDGKKTSIHGMRRRQCIQWHTGCTYSIKRLAEIIGLSYDQQLWGSNSGRDLGPVIELLSFLQLS